MGVRHWLTQPGSIRIALTVFVLVLLGTLVAEAFVHTHSLFGIDGSFGFHAWFGAMACAGLIAVSKLLALFLKRKDTYYDD